MEVSYAQAPDLEKIRTKVASLGFTDVQVQNFGTARDVMIRLPAQKGVSSAQQSDKVRAQLKADTAGVKKRDVVRAAAGAPIADAAAPLPRCSTTVRRAGIAGYFRLR